MTTIALKHPFTTQDGGELKEINLRRPTVLDLELMSREKTDIGRSIFLLSNLAEMSPNDVRKMDAADFNAISETITGFLD